MERGSTYVFWGEQDKPITFSFDLMGVDEARLLKSHLSLKSVSGDNWTVVKANNITEEAQNART